MQGTSPSWPKAITFFFFSGEKEVVEEKVDNAGGFQQRNRKSQAFLYWKGQASILEKRLAKAAAFSR